MAEGNVVLLESGSVGVVVVLAAVGPVEPVCAAALLAKYAVVLVVILG